MVPPFDHPQLEAAAAVLRALLSDDPLDVEALANLGGLCLRGDRPADAKALFYRAAAIEPRSARLAYQCGVVESALGRQEHALERFDRAVALDADFGGSHHGRAVALMALGRASEAAAAGRSATNLAPDDVMSWVVLGEACAAIGARDEAQDCFRRAANLVPGLADQMAQHAAGLINVDRYDEALTLCDRALALEPGNVKGLNHKGVALNRLGRIAEAEAIFVEALRHDPVAADVWCNLATVLMGAGRHRDAERALDEALRLRQGFATAIGNRANLLFDMERFEEAAEGFAAFAAIAPGDRWVWSKLLAARAYICDWRDHEAVLAKVVAGLRAGAQSIAPFEALSLLDDPADQLASARMLAAAMQPAAPMAPRAPRAAGKIRLAYLSADFREHASAYLACEVFERHDRSAFEVIGLSIGPVGADAMGRRIAGTFDEITDIAALSHPELAELIRGKEIDVCIDMMGYTAHGRTGALARRPAPVQVSYLAYPGTLGAPFIDYLIGDAVVTPAGCEAFYDEQIVRLPACYQPNSARPLFEDSITRADVGLPADAVVFAAFSNPNKITPSMFAVWMQILRSCEGSVLWLFADGKAAQNLRGHAREAGVEPTRLVFAAYEPRARHLARLELADIALDTAPYGAHTTASDFLWAGVPIVTCAGRTMASRVATSLTAAVGHADLNTASMADYQALAVRYGNDRTALAAMKASLLSVRESAPLFDVAAYTVGLETAYRRMVERARESLPPWGFDLSADPR